MGLRRQQRTSALEDDVLGELISFPSLLQIGCRLVVSNFTPFVMTGLEQRGRDECAPASRAHRTGRL